MASLRSQLLKEMSSLVPSGTKKGARSENSNSSVKDFVAGDDVRQEDEETLEILQGNSINHPSNVISQLRVRCSGPVAGNLDSG